MHETAHFTIILLLINYSPTCMGLYAYMINPHHHMHWRWKVLDAVPSEATSDPPPPLCHSTVDTRPTHPPLSYSTVYPRIRIG